MNPVELIGLIALTWFCGCLIFALLMLAARPNEFSFKLFFTFFVCSLALPVLAIIKIVRKEK